MQKREKKAFITGITGQDGSYLAELLLEKGYRVYGLVRYSSVENTKRIAHLLNKPNEDDNVKLYYGDLTDGVNLVKPIKDIRPDEVYNLAAQSHVGISGNMSVYTANTNALGVLRLLEAIDEAGLTKTIKFYQASTSDLFGDAESYPQDETTPFLPNSAYACAKLYAHHTVKLFRDKRGLFGVNGIAYGHESPRRAPLFVTKKITRAAAAIKCGLADKLYLGNLSAVRDWGHAKDYVNAMYLSLQAKEPDDYVLATGKATSVRDFCRLAFKEAGINLEFTGKGKDEKATDTKTGKVIIEVKEEFYRPAEIIPRIGNSAKAQSKLGWKRAFDINSTVKEMVSFDLKETEKGNFGECK